MVYKPHFFTLNFPGKLGMQLICESIWTPCCKFACLLRQKSILHDHEPDQMPGYKATSERTEAFILLYVKALANLDTLLPTQLFPRLHAHATFVADTNFVSGTQRMFLILFRNIVSATNVSQFAQPKKHHGQQCVRKNVSSFTRALNSTEKWTGMKKLTFKIPEKDQFYV